MKKISTLFCAGILMSALCAGFVACNESQGTEPKDPELPEVIGINPVPVSDVPEEVAAFFKMHLPRESLSYPSVKFDFGNVNNYDTVCIVINSVDEFKVVAPPSVELPAIDFEKYTLIIGHHEDSSGYRLKHQGIDTDPDVMILNLIYEVLEGPHHDAMVTRFYWGLYPKLPQKPVSINVIR